MCAMEIEDFVPFSGAYWPTFWPEQTQAEAERSIQVASAEGVGRFQGYCPTAKGKAAWWDVVVTPIYDDLRRVEALLAVSRDITELTKVYSELAAQLAAREASAVKLNC